MVPVKEVGGFGSGVWRPVDVPYVIGTVKLSITWRIDGTSDRSKPLEVEHGYASEPFA